MKMQTYIIEGRVDGRLTQLEITTNAGQTTAKSMFYERVGTTKAQIVSITLKK